MIVYWNKFFLLRHPSRLLGEGRESETRNYFGLFPLMVFKPDSLTVDDIM